MLEIKGNMGQCKSEHQDFKKAKEKTWDSVSLRKETLKNRKVDFRSKVLKKDFRSKALKSREEKKQQGCCASPSEGFSIRGPNTPGPNFLHVCLLFVCPFCISCHPQLTQLVEGEQGSKRKLAPWIPFLL
jgi:hypothetical protein